MMKNRSWFLEGAVALMLVLTVVAYAVFLTNDAFVIGISEFFSQVMPVNVLR